MSSGPREFDAPRGERTAADGLLIVDKPQGWTSHDVVARTRRMAATKKVGHAGTLDPMATGVLVLGIGRATKLLTYVVGADKTYSAVIRLGAATLTDDAEGEITTAAGVPESLDQGTVEAALDGLRGSISQVPSTVSAIKVDGKRSYARVRAGEDVQLAARPVTISRFEITGEPQRATVSHEGREVSVLDVPVIVDCSSGTYIRALARDLGEALGVGGHLTVLRREAVGEYRLDRARSVGRLADLVREHGELPVLDLTEACRALFPVRELDAQQAADVRVGKFLPATGTSEVTAALSPDGRVVALVQDRRRATAGTPGGAKPVLVLDPA